MKNTKSLLMLCMLLASFQTIATVRTVSNLGGSQYSTLQAAYTASANGDTLMIEGSANVYNGTGSPTNSWDKSLVVIGSGFNANKQNFVPVTICTYCNGLTLNFSAGAAGSKFYGISTDDLNVSGSSNLQFHDCKFGSVQGNISNCTFKNCVFTGTDYNINPSIVTNLTISNCIFNGRILYSSNSIANFLIDHCLFLRTTGYVFDTNGGCTRNTTIRNSILMNCTAIAPACTSSNLIFVNCVSRNNLSTSGITTASGLAFTSYTNGSFWSTSHDYHCTDAAIVLAGDDGTDIGLHGGTANFSEKGEPLIVNIVRTITVGNTAPPNGTLNVTITAGKPTDQ